MGKVLTIIPALLTLVLAVACSSNTCRDSISAVPEATFYSSSLQSAITVDSLTVYAVGAPGDSAIIRNSAASQVYLPFRGSVDNCQFVFHYEQVLLSDPRLNDTLTVEYTAVPRFVSSECGAMYYYEVSGCSSTSHLIDSVSIVNADVTNVAAETIRIYFRTAEE